MSTAPQGAFARSASIQSAQRVVSAQAQQAQECAAQRLRLDGSAGHRIVDLLQGGKVVSVLCAVCGSYGGRAKIATWQINDLELRRLGDCWTCATRCWVSCLVPSALHDLTVFLGKLCVPSLVHVAPKAYFLGFCPAPFCTAAPLNVSIEPAPVQARHCQQRRVPAGVFHGS